ncbi:MAG TPA: hypothetical protein VJI98_02925 [Candidatus Nanoarchaeia archaeon]|nr:hypothetical protein [Candidatus Nanoarchaeia archaeon]
MRKLLSVMAFFIISLLAVSVAAVPEMSTLGTLNAGMVTVEVNDETVNPTSTLVVEEGEELNIEVELAMPASTVAVPQTGAEGIEVVARLSGYEYSDSASLEDSTELFDLRAGTRKTVDLKLTVPNDLENGLNTLRVLVLDRNSAPIVLTFPISVESPRHSVVVEDVSFSPGNTVKAGRALLTTVLVENYGDRTEENVKVTVAIPALGVSATDFVDEVKAGKTENVFGDFQGGLLLNIPADAAAGEYNVEVTLRYDNLKKSTTETFKVNVLGDERFDNVDKLVLAVGPEMQNVRAGSTASYGIALTNGGSASKAYTISTKTGDWASASLSDSLVVLAPGQNAVVYVDVAVAENAPVGEQVVAVSIMSGDETVNTVALNANVVEGSDNMKDPVSLRNGLEIALIVLVVLLVIIGLIVGFSRLRKDDDEDQTYY